MSGNLFNDSRIYIWFVNELFVGNFLNEQALIC